ncbi:hypothetical protein GBF35_45615 [Nonomuraea phyllanthi]|uniref:hypothetical protein n=1 Tax=Nonomuraea phyllanthi TaxID=2219224 RepID=UPI001293197B|nr:hypothetical protein [Nonomuraea phyllanthi]QFY12881.1 hypothetical protein GBF35_45615 [Nonomuraea phyllanthi]
MAVAIARPHRSFLITDGGGDTLVAGAAEERVHLGFDGSLDNQTGAEPGNALDDLDQVTIIDLGTDGLDGRYSTGHERGTSFVRTWRFNTEPTLVIYLHRISEATCADP